MLTAKEALELSLENKDYQLKQTMELIREASLKGNTHIIIPRGRTPVIYKLQDLGYNVSFSSTGGYYVSWSIPDEPLKD